MEGYLEQFRRIRASSAQIGAGERDETGESASVPSSEPPELTAEPPPLEFPSDTPVFEVFLRYVIQGYSKKVVCRPFATATWQRLEASTNPVAALDFDGTITGVNAAFCNAYAYAPEELVGTPLSSLLLREYRPALRGRLRRLRKLQELNQPDPSEEAASIDDLLLFRSASRDGTRISMECIPLCWHDPDASAPRSHSVPSSQSRSSKPGGTEPARATPMSAESTSCGVILAMRDLQMERSLLAQFHAVSDEYDALSETIAEAVLRITDGFEIVYANSAVKPTFGYTPSELIQQPFSILFPEGEFERHRETFGKYFVIDDRDRRAAGLPRTMEILGKHRHRGVSPMELSFGNSKQYGQRTITCIIRDITQRKRMERKLRHLAYHDQLTGLGNRDLFNSDLQSFLEAIGRMQKTKAAVLFLDLDGFKQVNDTLGHEAGDQLLVDTARRLREVLRENDSVYRFGGDEFVVLLRQLSSFRDAALVGDKLLAAIRSPYRVRSKAGKLNAVSVGVSIGIALIPEHGNSVEELVKAADLAMYSAKHQGKNRLALYSADLDARNAFRWELDQGIRRGIENEEFYLCYQPLVDHDGYIKGVEALLRWEHPDRGIIPPTQFIPVAEESGLIVTLGNWVIQHACRDVGLLGRNGYSELAVAVNLSSKQFEEPSLAETIARAVSGSGLNPKNLRLEVTETSIMAAPEQAVQRMRELKEHLPGVTISIDDFGTGYSSLSYLSKLPADSLKIDLSFVSHLYQTGHDNNEKVINAIIRLAQSLGLEVVAEGVESPQQWHYFRQHACNTLQGFLFNPGVRTQELDHLLVRKRLGRPEALDDIERAASSGSTGELTER